MPRRSCRPAPRGVQPGQRRRTAGGWRRGPRRGPEAGISRPCSDTGRPSDSPPAPTSPLSQHLQHLLHQSSHADDFDTHHGPSVKQHGCIATWFSRQRPSPDPRLLPGRPVRRNPRPAHTELIADDVSETQLRDRYRARYLLPVGAETVDRIMNDTGLARSRRLVLRGSSRRAWNRSGLQEPGKRRARTGQGVGHGEEAGYGSYVRFACPAYSHVWAFCGPLGVLQGWGTTVDLVHIFKGEGGWLHGWFAPLSGLWTVFLIGCCFVSRYERRTGGPTPRLYCFQLGVVVATGDVLRAYRWAELTLHRKEWRSGSGGECRLGDAHNRDGAGRQRGGRVRRERTGRRRLPGHGEAP